MPEKEYVTIKDDEGNEKVFEIDAMFEMNGHTYAMITADDDTLVMKVEYENGEQTLVSATDEEMENLIDAYNIAINTPLEEE